MTADNVICVKDKKDCPITWIKWVKDLKGLDLKNVTVQNSGENGYLMFSKAVDALPIISIKMLQKKPCLDPIQEVKANG